MGFAYGDGENSTDISGRVDKDEFCKYCNSEKMNFEELVIATIKGNCHNGNDRRVCLAKMYDSVQNEVNRRLTK